MYTINKKKIKKLLVGNNIEPDTIDINSYSGDIPFTEWMLNEYGIVLKGFKEQVDDVKSVLEKQKLEESKRIEEEEKRVKQDFEKWKEHKSPLVLTDKTETVRHYINMIVSDKIHSLIIKSRTGLGKSYCVLNLMKKIKADFVYKNGYTTALALYKYLAEHKDKIIILDDLDSSIFKDKKIVSILKAILWDVDGKRFVSYESTAKQMEEIPNQFEFTGKILILTNELFVGNNENFKALISRAIHFELEYTFTETIKIAHKIIDQKELTLEQNKRVKEIISRQVTEISEFNFRKLEHLICMVKYNESLAEDLYKYSTEENEDLSLVLTLFKSDLPIKLQISRFIDETGKSRSTYFRLKKRIEKLI